MIRIDTDQLDELIHKDYEIQKELDRHLKDDKKNYDACYEKYLEEQRHCRELQKEREKILKNIQEQQLIEDKLHSKINHLEVQKIFAERKLKRILKQMNHCKTEEEHQELLLQYASVQQEIADINQSQDDIREEIQENRHLITKLQQEDRALQEKEQDAEREQKRLQNNVIEWKISIETKTNLFYQKTFDTMMTYYEPLRDLLVRNLQKDKAMTKDEAKRETNGIIIEPGEEILVDPPGYVKRLTNEKKEEYRNVPKM